LQSPQATENFLNKYSPKRREEIALNRLKSVSNDKSNPRLQDVASVYGIGVVEQWLYLQLTYTFSLCGFDFVLGSKDTTLHVAALVAAEYPFLRLGELMLFLLDFEQGKFGDHQTRFNEQKFFSALRQFQQTRATLIEQNEQANKMSERANWSSKAVPCPQNLSIFKNVN
jgi:hypothetical protein